mmetsp:Transcript_6947/g.16888  ORF Transcript_6947/g.16888 Transcript_6947/m.16888 type:complete len:1035 (-) Transcript_6947:326-3430(-)
MKLGSYFMISAGAAGVNLLHAWSVHEQFYPAVIHLSSDKLSLALLYNFVFATFLLFGYATLKFFIGRLRDLEIEQLIDTGRGFLADTILFLVFYSPTIDQKEVATFQLMQYIVGVIFLKMFHLMAQIRVSSMFEMGTPKRSVKIKLAVLMGLMLGVDLLLVHNFYAAFGRQSTFYTWILFECVTMLALITVTIFKYTLHLIDTSLEHGWPGKAAYIFYLELVGDVCSMLIFLCFMGIFFLQNPNRLPIYMMADIVQVARQLTTRLRNFRKYRMIMSDFENKFRMADSEELANAETCIICRDDLHEGSVILPCGHIFHVDCLKSWLVMQQVCPTCRAEIPIDREKLKEAYREADIKAGRPARDDPGTPMDKFVLRDGEEYGGSYWAWVSRKKKKNADSKESVEMTPRAQIERAQMGSKNTVDPTYEQTHQSAAIHPRHMKEPSTDIGRAQFEEMRSRGVGWAVKQGAENGGSSSSSSRIHAGRRPAEAPAEYYAAMGVDVPFTGVDAASPPPLCPDPFSGVRAAAEAEGSSSCQPAPTSAHSGRGEAAGGAFGASSSSSSRTRNIFGRPPPGQEIDTSAPPVANGPPMSIYQRLVQSSAEFDPSAAQQLQQPGAPAPPQPQSWWPSQQFAPGGTRIASPGFTTGASAYCAAAQTQSQTHLQGAPHQYINIAPTPARGPPSSLMSDNELRTMISQASATVAHLSQIQTWWMQQMQVQQMLMLRMHMSRTGGGAAGLPTGAQGPASSTSPEGFQPPPAPGAPEAGLAAAGVLPQVPPLMGAVLGGLGGVQMPPGASTMTPDGLAAQLQTGMPFVPGAIPMSFPFNAGLFPDPGTVGGAAAPGAAAAAATSPTIATTTGGAATGPAGASLGTAVPPAASATTGAAEDVGGAATSSACSSTSMVTAPAATQQLGAGAASSGGTAEASCGEEATAVETIPASQVEAKTDEDGALSKTPSNAEGAGASQDTTDESATREQSSGIAGELPARNSSTSSLSLAELRQLQEKKYREHKDRGSGSTASSPISPQYRGRDGHGESS